MPLATATAPVTTSLVVIGKVDNRDITGPDLTRDTATIQQLASTVHGYKNLITSETEKVFVGGELVKVKQHQKRLELELKKITDPLVESRRQALAAKNAAENLFAAPLQMLAQIERSMKDEILRWDTLVERKRIEEQREAERLANQERLRLEAEAKRQADEAAAQNLESQRRAQALEAEGRTSEAESLRDQSTLELELAGESVQQTLVEAESVVASALVPSSSVKMKGMATTGKWCAYVDNVLEVLAGITSGATPFVDAVRVKVNGRLSVITANTPLDDIDVQGIEINLPWFNDRARKLGNDDGETTSFNYRGMKARFVRDLRVRA